MLKLTIGNKGKCEINIEAEMKQAIAEVMLANVALTQIISQNMKMSFEAAAMFLFQHTTLAHKQAMDVKDDDTNG